MFVASALACFLRLLLPDPLGGPSQGRRLAGLDKSSPPGVLTSAGSSRTRQASAATVTCRRSTAGTESGSVLDGRRPLRRTAAIPSASSTRPQPSGKMRQLAHRPEARRHGAVSPFGLTSRPLPGVGRPGRLRSRFGGAGSRRAAPRPGSPASPRPAPAGSRPCGVAGDSDWSRPAPRPGGAPARTVSRGTGTPARSHASARCRPSSCTDRRRWRPALGSSATVR